MSGSITFRVDHAPVGQPRARAVNRGKRAGMYHVTKIVNKKKGTSKPHPIVAFRDECRLAAMRHFQAPFVGPVEVCLLCVFPRTQAEMRAKSPSERLPHTKKPDGDNVLKAVQDALNRVAYVDDSQVCDVRVSKRIAAKDETPHVEISVVRL